MFIKRKVDPEEFQFWGWAKSRIDDATEKQRQLVYARLNDIFADEIPTEGEVNDFVWFNCNDIFYPDDKDDE